MPIQSSPTTPPVLPFEILTDAQSAEDQRASFWTKGASTRLDVRQLKELCDQANQAIVDLQWMRAEFGVASDRSVNHLLLVDNTLVQRKTALCGRRPQGEEWKYIRPIIGLLVDTDRTSDPYCKRCLAHYAKTIEEMSYS